jgi:nucleoside-diphosphate-sugar epimerase
MAVFTFLLGISTLLVDAKKPILVIGGTGRVGRAVTSGLLSNGQNVRLLVRNLDKVGEDIPRYGETPAS